MNEKEIGEIRRRFKDDRNAIGSIRGCYVNELKHIVSQFNQPLSMLSEDERDMFLGVLRKTLSGKLGKNLLPMEFETQQVAYGEEHKLLMTVRDSALKDDAAVEELFRRIVETVELEDSYLIMLVQDSYDVPYRGKDGSRQDDGGNEVYRYIMCSICPVKETKPALSYYMRENEFHNRQMNHLVSPPALGFLFPAFDERSTNLYGALFYTKDTKASQEAMWSELFRCQPPMPAQAQKETFQTIFSEALEGQGSYEVVEGVHQQLREMMEVHKESHEPEPLTLNHGEMAGVLRSCGVPAHCAEEFGRKFQEAFGEETAINPANVIQPKQVEVAAADVTVRLPAEQSDLVSTRVIDGVKYILIRAQDGVQVNGVDIAIEE